jgi:periplasmic divalent cation tolerance protein
MNETPHDPPLMVFSTAPDAETALRLVRAAVERRLIACGQILPGATSVYRWSGAIQTDPEALIVMKTLSSRFDALAALIATEHPYETPELIAVPTTALAGRYQEWLIAALDPPGREDA